MKKTIIVLFILIFILNLGFAKPKTETTEMSDEIPKNIIIISQSCTMSSLYISAIDLSNNELIIILMLNMTPAKAIVKVLRTGSFIDPQKQLFSQGTDAPFKPRDHN